MQYFNIQVASQLSGVASATIRAWEKRYHAVTPERGENQHRLYSEGDIEKLALLYKLTEFGQSIGRIAHLELTELKKVYTQLLHRPYDELAVVTPHHEKIDYDKILGSLLMALSAYKIDIISHELEKAQTLLSPRDFCLSILVPLFHDIGKKVERRELTIGQEHTLSALVSFYAGQMIGRYYQKILKRKELILIATPAGEMHEIGILASALLCIHYELKLIFMGINLPWSSLAEASNALDAKIIILGATHSDQIDLGSYLTSLKEAVSPNTEIWVGGNLKIQTRSELEKRQMTFFASLQALDEHLAKF